MAYALVSVFIFEELRNDISLALAYYSKNELKELFNNYQLEKCGRLVSDIDITEVLGSGGLKDIE